MVRDIQKIPDGNWVLDEAFTVKMMKIGKCPLKSWNQLCLVRAWQCTASLASLAGQLCQALFMGLGFSLFFFGQFLCFKNFCEMAANTFQLRTNNAAFFSRANCLLFWDLLEFLFFLGNDGIIVGFFSFFCYFVWYSSLSTFLSTVA